jgi:hypothetical protein
MTSERKESSMDARALLREWIEWTEACEMTFPATTFYAAKELLRQSAVTDEMIDRGARALSGGFAPGGHSRRKAEEVLRAALEAPDA